MSKPTTLPEWSSDQSNMTAPSSTQKQTGWTPGQDGVSDFDNWVKYWTYKWLEWLAQAQLNDGTVNYNHSDTVQDDHDFAGTGSLENVHTVYVTPVSTGEDEWYIQGIVGGTDKQEIQIINTDATNYLIITDQAFSSSTAAYQIILPEEWTYSSPYIHVMPGGSIRLRYHGASSRWRVISGTSIRVCRRFTVPVSGAQWNESGGSSLGDGSVVMGNAPYSVYFPCVASPGSKIRYWQLYANKTSNSSFSIGARMYKRDGDDAASAGLGASEDVNTVDAPGFITLGGSTNGLVNTEVPTTSPSTQYYLEVSSSTDEILHADFHVWVPI